MRRNNFLFIGSFTKKILSILIIIFFASVLFFSIASPFDSGAQRPKILATAGPNGTITLSGYVEGSLLTFRFLPDEGFTINAVLVDGVNVGSPPEYTFSTVQSDHTINVSFAPIITAFAGPNGNVSPSGAVTVSPGSDPIFTIRASDNYRTLDVLVDGVSVGSVYKYQFTNVTTPHTISASFGNDQSLLRTISASSGPNGTVMPSGNIKVEADSYQKFTFTPYRGLVVENVFVDGSNIGSPGEFTFNNPDSDHTIYVTFTPAITAGSGPNGNIRPSGTIKVSMGSDQAFEIIPDTGYHVANVIVDGLPAGPVSSYNFKDLRTSHTITANFAESTPPILQSVLMDPPSPHKPESVNFFYRFNEAMDTSVSPDVLFINGENQYAFSGSDWSIVNGVYQWCGSYTFTPDMPNGEYSITVSGARDAAGNMMEPASGGTFILDTIPPNIPSVNRIDPRTDQRELVLSGTKDSRSGIYLNGGQLIAPDNLSKWKVTYSLQPGQNELAITSRDETDNESGAVNLSVYYDDSPKGIWHFEDKWADSSGNGHDLTPNGPKFGPGLKGDALLLDGIDDYASTPLIFSSPPNKMSIEAWVKPSAQCTENYQFILRHGQGGEFGLAWKCNAGKFSFSTCSLGYCYFSDTNGSYASDEWHYVVVLYSPLSTKIYIDGILDSTSRSSSIGNTTSDYDFRIGSYNDIKNPASTRKFNGLIDELAIYGRPLTDQEIKNHYNLEYLARPIVNAPYATNSALVTLSGTKLKNYSILINGSEFIPSDAYTSWEKTYQLQPGWNLLKIEQEDAYENVSPHLLPQIFYDDSAPVISNSDPQDNSRINSSPGRISLVLYDISGVDIESTISGATVKNESSGELIPGSWDRDSFNLSNAVFTPASTLEKGTYLVSIHPADSLGNRTDAGIQFTIDKTPPAQPVPGQPTYQVVGSPSITLSGSKEENSSVLVNGQTIIPLNSSGKWNFTRGLNPGTNSLNITSKDDVENESSPVVLEIVYDNSPPFIESSTPAASSLLAAVSQIKINLNDLYSMIDYDTTLSSSTLKNSLGRVLAGTWSNSGDQVIFSPASILPDNTYTVTIHTADALGNPADLAFSFSIDSVPPFTSVQLDGTKGNDDRYKSSVKVSMSAEDGRQGSGVDRIEYSFDGLSWKIYSAPFRVDQEGVTTLYYRAIDRAGNIEKNQYRKNVALYANGASAYSTSIVNQKDTNCISTPLFSNDGQVITITASDPNCSDKGTWLENAIIDSLMIRFNGEKVINELRWIAWADSSWTEPQSQTNNYYVEYTSDPVPSVNAGNWTAVPNLTVLNTDGLVDPSLAYVSGNTNGNWFYDTGKNWITHEFSPVSATAVRIRVESKLGDPSYGPAIGEMEVYEFGELKSRDIAINKSGGAERLP